MRSGRRPQRRRGAMPVKIHGEIDARDAAEELALGEVEDLAFPLVFEESAPQQQGQRKRNQLSHATPKRSAETPRRTAPPPQAGESPLAPPRCAPRPLHPVRSRWSARPSAP